MSHFLYVNNGVTTCSQTWYRLVFTASLQACWNGLVTDLSDTTLLQPCSDRLVTTWWPQQLVNKLFQQAWYKLLSTSCYNVVPTTCYKSASQQVVTSLMTTSLLQVVEITSLLQLVDKLATSLFRQQLVDKMWDFYVCSFNQLQWN